MVELSVSGKGLAPGWVGTQTVESAQFNKGNLKETVQKNEDDGIIDF